MRDKTIANKEKMGRDEALALAKQADRVIAMKGKKVVRFERKKDPPDDDTLAAHLLGPTGNLRAPTIRIGKTLLIGFNGEVFEEVFG